MNGISRRPRQFLWVAAVALPALLWGAGCGKNGQLSREKIYQGERAVSEAKEGNAGINAPVELKSAEDKLAVARAAMAAGEYGKAIQMAEEALVDADYARAKASSAKTKKTAEEMRRNINALRQEIERLPK